MPGYIIHLTKAKMLLESIYKDVYDENARKCFILGSVVCDGVIKANKVRTHFWKEDALDHFYKIPEIGRFEEKYKKEIEEKEPMIMGVYHHLLLDYYFYTHYWPTILEPNMYDFNHNEHEDDGLKVRIKWSDVTYSRDEFYSKEILYGDYTRLNEEFKREYQPELPTLEDIPLYEKAVKVFEEADGIDLVKLVEDIERLTTTYDVVSSELKVYKKEDIVNILKMDSYYSV